jgi:GT2 family glycosyltransferase
MDTMRLHEWPSNRQFRAAERVGVVMVSYNTIAVTAQAIYALLRTIRTPDMRLVVVDNGSTDGSGELLTALAAAGLCEVIANSDQRYHGPALTQAMDHLAATQTSDCRVGPVWILDSDCIVLRSDTYRLPSL